MENLWLGSLEANGGRLGVAAEHLERAPVPPEEIEELLEAARVG